MQNWTWEKVEARLRRHVTKAERQLQVLLNYSKSALGAELGVKPSTPCELVEDASERRRKLKAVCKVIGKKPFKGAVLLHRCDDGRCVAVDHLHWGTQADNMRDCALKGRHPRGSGKPVEERIAELRAKIFLWNLQLARKALI